jgi:NitT/TauT family transport system substrate-binding protein
MVVVLAALVAFAAGTGGAVAQDMLKVSVPQRGSWDTGISELGQRAGIFKRHGVTLDILYTEGGAESQQAVIGGSMDIAAGVGVGSVLSAFTKGAPVRVFSGEMIGSPNQFWYVPANSPIRALGDLAGRTIGYSVTGSSSHLALLELLRQYHVAAKPTATGGMPGTLTAAMSGQIDVGWASAPFAVDLVEEGKIRIIARGTDVAVLNDRTVRWNITNLDMLAKRADAIQRYMTCGPIARPSTGCTAKPPRSTSMPTMPSCRRARCAMCAITFRERRSTPAASPEWTRSSPTRCN